MGLHRRLHLSEMASEGGEGGHGGRQSRTDSGTRSSEKTDGEASEAGKEHGRRAWVPARWSMGRGLARRGRARARAPEEDGAAAELKRLGELGLHGCESGLARMQAARDVDAENLEAGSRFPALGARDDAKNSIGWRSTASTLE